MQEINFLAVIQTVSKKQVFSHKNAVFLLGVEWSPLPPKKVFTFENSIFLVENSRSLKNRSSLFAHGSRLDEDLRFRSSCNLFLPQ